MKYLFLLLALTITTLAAQSPLELGIEAFENRAHGSREDLAKGIPIQTAIDYLEKAITDSVSELDAAVYLLKSYYYRGKFTGLDKDEQKAVFQQGKDLGEKYIAAYPRLAALRYWYLSNLGSWAEVYGIFAAAKAGVSDLMKHHSEIIISLDPNYEDGGGYFMLGAVHFKSPYIPFILSWPDNDDAIKNLKLAIGIGEATPVQKVYLAQALYKDGQKTKAIRLLEEVSNMVPSKEEPVEDWEQIKKARSLLDKYK